MTRQAWVERRLGDLVRLTSGQSPSGFSFRGTGTPYFKVDQLGKSSKYLGRRETPYLAQGLPTVPAGSVLIAKRGGAIALNRVRVLREPGFMDTNVMALTPRDELEPEFLYYWLSYRGLWDVADVTSVPQINNKHINPLVIALPGLLEQRRIVDALQSIDSQVEALEGVIVKKRAIKQGLMQELLTGGTRLSRFTKEWAPITLGSLGSTYGGLVGKSGKDFGHGSGRFITFVEVMRDARLRGVEFAQVDIKLGERQNAVQRGDMLFNGSSETPEEVALAAAVEFDAPGVLLNSFCFGYRPTRPNTIDPLFLAYFFRATPGRDLIVSLAQGSTRYNIAKSKLMKVTIELPDFAEQCAISAALRDADDELDVLERRLEVARAIKQGMMQELLTGRTPLVPTEASV